MQQSQLIRKFYRLLVPESLRSRIVGTTFVQSLRESIKEDEQSLPYELLQEKHIANLQTVINRNAFLGRMEKDAIVAEIGVNRGDFSRRIINYAQPKELHLIDIWDSERYHSGLHKLVEDKFTDEINDGLIKIHRGYSTEVLYQFEDGFFDWVYIDTDHSYSLTAQELMIASRKVKPGGIICGHDYITGDWKLRYRYGVVEAVNEFCVQNDWEMVFITHETHRHLSYGIRQIQS